MRRLRTCTCQMGRSQPFSMPCRRGVPVVVHTGVGLPTDVRARHPGVPVYSKPTAPSILLARLGDKLDER